MWKSPSAFGYTPSSRRVGRVSFDFHAGNAKVRMSSISGINGALGDMGQNYKNLAFLAAGLGWDPPTVAFGCGHR